MKKSSKKLAARIVLARTPHLATGEIVELYGAEPAKRLYAAFAEYNAAHFDSSLGSPLILITQAKSARTLGDYIARDVHGLESRIRIAPRAVLRGELLACDVLLHEMVHAWAEEIEEDGEDSYRGHGPKFAKKCNEIGAALGLPPVGVKGRDGLPDCKAWPMCVRPAGFYPEEFVAPTRKPKAEPKERTPKDDNAAPEPTIADKLARLLGGLSLGELGELAALIETEIESREQQQQAAE